MSWSVAASGKSSAVSDEIAKQISKISLSDEGEMETVKRTGELIGQTLGTFDPDGLVNVNASGHMGFKDWGAKSGPYQNVSISIAPIHLSV